MLSFRCSHSFSIDRVKKKKQITCRINSQQKNSTNISNTNIPQQQSQLINENEVSILRKKIKNMQMYMQNKKQQSHFQQLNLTIYQKNKQKFTNVSNINSLICNHPSKGSFKCNANVYQLVKNFTKPIDVKPPKKLSQKKRYNTTSTQQRRQKLNRTIINIKNYTQNINNNKILLYNEVVKQNIKSNKNIELKNEQNNQTSNLFSKKYKQQFIINRKIKKLLSLNSKNKQYNINIAKLTQNVTDNIFIKKCQSLNKNLSIQQHQQKDKIILHQQYINLSSNLLKKQKQLINQQIIQIKKKFNHHHKIQPKINNYHRSIQCVDSQVQGWKTNDLFQQEYFY